MYRRILLLVLLIVSVHPLGGHRTWACTVPVFRYALERWRAENRFDLYPVLIFHKGKLTQEQQELVNALREASERELAPANLFVETIDVEQRAIQARVIPSASIVTAPLSGHPWHTAGMSMLARASGTGPWGKAGPPSPSKEPQDYLARVWKRENKHLNKSFPGIPWMVVRYPGSTPDRPAAWSGPLTRKNLQQLLRSPVRRELARRLLAGDSVVWLILEPGQPSSSRNAVTPKAPLPTEDGARAKKTADKESPLISMLSRELKRLQKTIKLPPEDPTVRLLSRLPLKVQFSYIRVSRDDPRENLFVRTLLNSKPELAKYSGPILFPVFGRGRSLDGLVSKHATPDTIADDAHFLCGPCSCRVKRLNPGFDLLLATDWDSILEDRKAQVPTIPILEEGTPVALPPAAPVLEGVEGSREESKQAVPQGKPAGRGSRSLVLWVGLALAGGMVLVTGLLVWRRSATQGR